MADESLSPGRYEMIRTSEDTWAAFQQLFQSERVEIDLRLRRGEIVVVDGPRGVGKSRNLFGPLINQREAEGYTTFDWAGYLSIESGPKAIDIEKRMLPVLQEGEKRYMAIDEFVPMISTDPEGTQHLLETFHENHVEILLVNAYINQARRDKLNRTMMAFGDRTGIPVYIHRVRATHLPPELAQAHLMNVNHADQELIDFVVDPANRALLSPGAFYLLVEDSKTVVDVRKAAEAILDKDYSPKGLDSDPLTTTRGGSKEEMIRALRNMRIELSGKKIKNTPDYD